MAQQFGREVPDVEPEDGPLAHRHVAARGRVQEAVVAEPYLSELEQPPADVGVLTMELDRRVEAADRVERFPAHREVAAVEDGADAKHVLDEQLRGGGEREVIGANEQAP